MEVAANGKIVLLDIDGPGCQIGERLFRLLDAKQWEGLIRYALETGGGSAPPVTDSCSTHPQTETDSTVKPPLTEIYAGDVYLCMEYRSVEVRGKEIDLTAKEFDILSLLVMNPKRVFTYEMISAIVWDTDHDIYIRKTIINHVSNLRKKLRTVPDVPAYIKNVQHVGYRFNP